MFHHYIGQYSFYLPFNTKKQVAFPWLVERVDLSACNWEMNASGEWDIKSAYLSLCRVGMTQQSESSTVFRRKKPVKFARAQHNNWRVRWKKGVRYFTQNRTLSKTLQISHAVLFRCLKQCSACFFPEACFLLEILRMRKNTFFRGHPLGTFCWMKNKRTFCFAKRWSHYNTLIIYYCFVSASG